MASNEDLQKQITELRNELTSVQTALSLVLSAEHRELVNSKDVRKVFMDMIQEMRQEDEDLENRSRYLRVQMEVEARRLQMEMEIKRIEAISRQASPSPLIGGHLRNKP